MQTANRMILNANHAMWARDYEGAFEFYNRFLHLEITPNPLLLYRVHFDLAIVSAILRKHEQAEAYEEKLTDFFSRIEMTRRSIKDTTRLGIKEICSLITREVNPEKMESLLREYFPSDEKLLTFFISPRYARGFLRAAIRQAQMSEPPKVLKEGILIYTLSHELYRVIAKAYSTQELVLEKLRQSRQIRVLIDNPNVFYVEDEKLRIIAAVLREGLVLCHYLPQSLRDTEGADRVHAFIHNLSEAISKQQ